MLVIRRRAGESLLIGSDIEIEILDVGASYVKIGIRAPREVPLLRKEIHLTGQQNQAASREVSPAAIASLQAKLSSSRTPLANR
jgi:carbon storage regulator